MKLPLRNTLEGYYERHTWISLACIMLDNKRKVSSLNQLTEYMVLYILSLSVSLSLVLSWGGDLSSCSRQGLVSCLWLDPIFGTLERPEEKNREANNGVDARIV